MSLHKDHKKKPTWNSLIVLKYVLIENLKARVFCKINETAFSYEVSYLTGNYISTLILFKFFFFCWVRNTINIPSGLKSRRKAIVKIRNVTQPKLSIYFYLGLFYLFWFLTNKPSTLPTYFSIKIKWGLHSSYL